MNELQKQMARRIESIGYWLFSATEWMQRGDKDATARSLQIVGWQLQDIAWETRKADGWSWEAN